MTTAFSDTQTIRATPEVVWRTLTDWSRASEWMPGVESMSSPADLAVGSTLTFVARGKERSSTVSALESGRLLTMTSRVGGVVADYRYTVEPSGDASTVTLVADVETSGVMKLLGKVIRSAIAKEDGVQLTRLKALVEAG